ncbi:hypothetical protein BJ912DRAFT_475832 [Pholiota molesta]|nr:hypothetical protein BJ912DRAFT_475832 [Pholiota molesta]
MASNNQREHSRTHSVNHTLSHMYSAYGDQVSRNISPSVPPPDVSPAPLSNMSPLLQALSEPGYVTPRSIHTHLPPSYSGGLENLSSSHHLSFVDRYPGIRPLSRVALHAPRTLNLQSSERPPTNSPRNPRVALPPTSIPNRIQTPSSSHTRVSSHDTPASRIHSPLGRIQSLSPINARPPVTSNFSPVSRRIPAAQTADPLFLPSSSVNSPRYPSPASGLRYNYTRPHQVSVPATPISRQLDSPFNYQHSPLALITSPVAPIPSPIISPALPSPSTPALPNTKNIPLLTGRTDWGGWHDGVIALLIHSGVLNHVNSPTINPGTYYPPNFVPTYPPIVSTLSSVDEKQTSALWWSRDQIASYIILSRLSPTVRNVIPSRDPNSPVQLSARDFYERLKQYYGGGDYGTAMLVAAKLRTWYCGPSVSVSTFITTW